MKKIQDGTAKESAALSGGSEPVLLSEIEQFILAVGSDNLATFGGTHEGGIHLQQVSDELAPCLMELLKYKDEIRTYLEIGSAAGGTAFIFNHFFKLNQVILIDDNKHHKHQLRPEILKGINREEIIGRSEDQAVINAVSDLHRLFDLILIDGDHDYKSAKLDFILYFPFLRPGGILFLHDSVYAPAGVGRLVDEIKTGKTMELIGEYVSAKTPKCGIALFRKAGKE
jgi:predicted O-methyltransferase YrrM